jgi:acetyl-CoA carboxylase biotin carboxyl carrier protein
MDDKRIDELIDRFTDSDLSELVYENDGTRLKLKRGSTAPAVVPAAATPAPMPATAIPSSTAGAASSAAPAPAVETASGGEMITAPIVGTFYRSAGPDAPPFVEEGKSVKAGDTICILEAMKIMNKLEADFDCEIVRILAENGTMVEYGTPLFEVKRA